MCHTIAVRRAEQLDHKLVCIAIVLDDDKRVVVGPDDASVGATAQEAIGKAIMEHPSLFPEIKLEIEVPPRKPIEESLFPGGIEEEQ